MEQRREEVEQALRAAAGLDAPDEDEEEVVANGCTARSILARVIPQGLCNPSKKAAVEAKGIPRTRPQRAIPR